MEGALEVVLDALECKTPARIPSLCLGADWDFMERYIAEIGFTFEEFQQFKKDGLPWLCPAIIPLSVKLGVDLTWIPISGPLTWLDHLNLPAESNGGLFKVVTRFSTYQPPVGCEKHLIPHWWWLKEGLTTKEAIEEHIKKDLKYSPKSFKKYKKLIETCEKKYNLVLSIGLTGPWEFLHFGIGFSNIAKFWRKDRKFLHEVNDYFCNIALDGMKNLVKIAQPKVVMIGDDYGFNSGLQMSLEMWRSLVKPTLSEHVGIIHEAGAKCLLHSCGNIEVLFDELVEIGLDGVESLKPFNNDLPQIKKKYGDKIALLGTIDDTNLLKHGTPEEVKSSVKKSIDSLGPHGYIPGATNFLLDQTVQNILAMHEAINEYKIR
ncbi:MAG: uroporphyrinogen decarboxylase family protein [Promethearchaeota archaeon]